MTVDPVGGELWGVGCACAGLSRRSRAGDGYARVKPEMVLIGMGHEGISEIKS